MEIEGINIKKKMLVTNASNMTLAVSNSSSSVEFPTANLTLHISNMTDEAYFARVFQ